MKVTLSQSTVTYPLGTNVVIQVAPTNGHTPTGTVKLYDGSNFAPNLRLARQRSRLPLHPGPGVGAHSLTAAYSGDKYNAAGNSAPVTLTVNPVPVHLDRLLECQFPLRSELLLRNLYQLRRWTSAGRGHVSVRWGPSRNLALANWRRAVFIPQPQAGTHTVVMGYAAQTNYAAAKSSTVNFTVTKAPVIVQLTPSTWYLTGGNLTLTASIQSWSAGPPNQLGTVTFSNGGKVLATVPVSAAGTAATTLAASSLSNGSHTLTATYSGSSNYSAGSGAVTITVAVK